MRDPLDAAVEMRKMVKEMDPFGRTYKGPLRTGCRLFDRAQRECRIGLTLGSELVFGLHVENVSTGIAHVIGT